ncbi:ABC-type sugar transport system permease subunit [Kribbella aluminosa]|uniref:ABC-type sugar transport system permease subunit n=1 Tax=Kribbella aluminosa TaxID=416017 RepID=A0ABS4UWP2_9ACTN|nr:sugar ABC transporter permease [Kribbella aluminosa]MBP2355961.1 ABC-type sugar transport system permease subunit [Kribbella aluminosa]
MPRGCYTADANLSYLFWLSRCAIVYFLWDKAFRSLDFGYGSAAAYVLFAITLLTTIGVVVYSRRKNMEAF